MRQVFEGVLGRREESLAVQTIILTAARAAGFTVTFAIPIVLVRVFDQAHFGIYKQFFLIAGTSIPILGLGMGASLFYFIPRDQGEGHHYILQAIGLTSLTAGIAGLALTLGAEEISDLLNVPALREYFPVLGLLVVISTPAGFAPFVPTIDRRPVIAAITLAGSDLVQAAVVVGAAVLTGSLRAVFWAAVACAALRCLWLLLYVRVRRPPRSKRPDLLQLGLQLRYSLPFAVAVLFRTGLNGFHQYYVTASVPPAEFAIYAIGIIQLPVVGYLVQSAVEVMVVRASAAYKAGDRAELRRLWTGALTRLAVVILPCWALAELLANDLIGLLFGPAYQASVPIFRIFLLTLLVLTVVDHGILRSTGDTSFMLAANVVGFAVSAVAVIYLTRYSVLIGGVTGYVVGLTVMRCMGLVKVASRLEIRRRQLLPWSSLARITVATLVSASVAALPLALPDRWLRLAIATVLFAAVYFGIVLRWELVPRGEIMRVLRRVIPTYRVGR